MSDTANKQTSSHPVLTVILVVMGIIFLSAGFIGAIALGLHGMEYESLAWALAGIPGAVMVFSPFVLRKDISYKVFYCAPAIIGLFVAILGLAYAFHTWRRFAPGDLVIVFGGLLLIITSLAVIFRVSYKKVILCACVLLIAHAALQAWYVFREFIRFDRGIETPQGLILAGNALFIIAFLSFPG